MIQETNKAPRLSAWGLIETAASYGTMIFVLPIVFYFIVYGLGILFMITGCKV